jgi:hypothetical protein
MSSDYGLGRWRVRQPQASAADVASEPAPFPQTSTDSPLESWYPDWRRRLTRNLARRSSGRWDPLTWTHGPPRKFEGPGK